METEDQAAIEKLTQHDTLAMDQADYKQFESLSTEVEDRCEGLFLQWLIAKTLKDLERKSHVETAAAEIFRVR